MLKLQFQAEMLLENWEMDNSWKLEGVKNSKAQAVKRCVSWQSCRGGGRSPCWCVMFLVGNIGLSGCAKL